MPAGKNQQPGKNTKRRAEKGLQPGAVRAGNVKDGPADARNELPSLGDVAAREQAAKKQAKRNQGGRRGFLGFGRSKVAAAPERAPDHAFTSTPLQRVSGGLDLTGKKRKAQNGRPLPAPPHASPASSETDSGRGKSGSDHSGSNPELAETQFHEASLGGQEGNYDNVLKLGDDKTDQNGLTAVERDEAAKLYSTVNAADKVRKRAAGQSLQGDVAVTLEETADGQLTFTRRGIESSTDDFPERGSQGGNVENTAYEAFNFFDNQQDPEEAGYLNVSADGEKEEGEKFEGFDSEYEPLGRRISEVGQPAAAAPVYDAASAHQTYSLASPNGGATSTDPTYNLASANVGDGQGGGLRASPVLDPMLDANYSTPNAVDRTAQGGAIYDTASEEKVAAFYDIGDAPQQNIITEDRPQGSGLLLSFIGREQWDAVKKDYVLLITGLNKHCHLWSNSGELAPYSNNCVAVTFDQLAELSLHPAEGDVWQDNHLELTVHAINQNFKEVQRLTLNIKAETIIDLLAQAGDPSASTSSTVVYEYAENTELVAENLYLEPGKPVGPVEDEDGYLAAKPNTDSNQAKPVEVESGDGLLIIDGSHRVACQLTLNSPPSLVANAAPVDRARLQRNAELAAAQAAKDTEERKALEQKRAKERCLPQAANALPELQGLLRQFQGQVHQMFSRQLPKRIVQENFSKQLLDPGSDIFGRTLLAQGGLKAAVDELLAAGLSGDAIKGLIDEDRQHPQVVSALRAITDFFDHQANEGSQIFFAAEVKVHLWGVIQEIYEECLQRQQAEADVAKKIAMIDASLAEFETALASTLSDPSKMPPDFGEKLDQYKAGGVKSEAFSALFEAQNKVLTPLLLGGGGQRGVKDAVDAMINTHTTHVGRRIATVCDDKKLLQAKACLLALPDFFVKPLSQLLAEKSSNADDDFGFGSQYEDVPEVTPAELMEDQLTPHLWAMVEKKYYELQLDEAVVAINADLMARFAAKKENKHYSNITPMLMQLKTAVQGVQGVKAIALEEKDLVGLISGKPGVDGNPAWGLMQDTNFHSVLFDGKEPDKSPLLPEYQGYCHEQYSAIKKAANKQVAFLLKCGVPLAAAIIVAAATILGLQYTDTVCFWDCEDGAPGNGPGSTPEESAAVLALAEHFAAACGVENPTEFLMAGGAIAIGIVGQQVKLNLTRAVNIALQGSAQFAYRFVTSAVQQLSYAGEVLQELTVFYSQGSNLLSEDVRVLASQAGTQDLRIERLIIDDPANATGTECQNDGLPLDIKPLNYFLRLSAANNRVDALNNGQPVPLHFSLRSSNVLPPGITLKASVKNVNNGVLQKANGDFIVGGADGVFPVSLDDIHGLKFLPSGGFAGEASPSLLVEAVDQATGAAIDLPAARVEKMMTIDYVAPLSRPTLSVTAPSALEGQAVILETEVFVDDGDVVIEKWIRHIPQGTRFTQGGNTYLAADADSAKNVVDISTWGDQIAVRREDVNDNGLYNFNVEAVARRASTNEVTRTTQSVTAQFDAVSDAVSIHHNATANVHEGSDLVIPLQLSAAGGAGDQLKGLQLTQLPAGTILTDAPLGSAEVTQTFAVPASGEANILSWGGWEAQQSVHVHFPSFYRGNAGTHQLKIGVRATTQEGSSQPKISESNVNVSFTPVSNPVSVIGAPDIEELQGNQTILFGWNYEVNSVDPHENITATVSGLPAGIVLAAPPKTFEINNGTAVVPLEQIPDLQVNVPEDFVGAFNATLRIESQYQDVEPAVTESTVGVRVRSILSPALVVDDYVGDEDVVAHIGKNIIVASNEPGSSVELDVKGIPLGARLSLGAKGNDGIWHITGGDIDNFDALDYSPVEHWSGNRTLTFEAYTGRGTGYEKKAVQKMQLSLEPHADTPIISAPEREIVTEEDILTVPLNLRGELVDLDGSESFFVEVTNVFNGALDRGKNKGGGVWRLTRSEAEAVRFKPAENWKGTQRLGARALAIEELNADVASSPIKSFNVKVTGVADGVIISAPDVRNDIEDTLGINLNLSLKLKDFSELVTIQVLNLPPNIGKLNKGDVRVATWTLASRRRFSGQAELDILLDKLKFVPAAEWDGVQTITFRMVTEDSVDIQRVQTQDQKLIITGVPDRPLSFPVARLRGKVNSPIDLLLALPFNNGIFKVDPGEKHSYLLRAPIGGEAIRGFNVDDLGDRWFRVNKGATATYVSKSSGQIQFVRRAVVREAGQEVFRGNAPLILEVSPARRRRGIEFFQDLPAANPANNQTAPVTLAAP